MTFAGQKRNWKFQRTEIREKIKDKNKRSAFLMNEQLFTTGSVRNTDLFMLWQRCVMKRIFQFVLFFAIS